MKNRLLPYAVVATTVLSLFPALPAAAQACEDQIGVDPDIEVAFVPNRTEQTISVVQVSPTPAGCQFTVIRTIGTEVGESPSAIFVHPDGRTAYVVQSQNDVLTLFDTRTGEVVKEVPIAFGSGALAGAMHPSGDFVYVSNLLTASVSVVDTRTGTSVDVPLGSPFDVPIGASVMPDGSQLWVTTVSGNSVEVFDIDNNPASAGYGQLSNQTPVTFPWIPIPGIDPTTVLPPMPVDVTFDDAGTAHLITLGRQADPALTFGVPLGTDGSGNPIWASTPDAYYRIDPNTLAVTLIETGDFGASSPLGPGAAEISVVPIFSGDKTWITNSGILSPTIPSIPIPPFTTHATTVSASGLSIVSVPTGGDSPVGLRLSPDRSLVYLTNFSSDELVIFDGTDESEIARIPVGDGPATPFGANIPRLPTAPVHTIVDAVSGDPISCNSSIPAAVNATIAFNLSVATTAFFVDETDLTLSAAFTGALDDSVMTPSLAGGLPGTTTQVGPTRWETTATSDFSWQVPFSAAGQSHSATFTATLEDQAGEQVFFEIDCQVTITVPAVPAPYFSEPINGEIFEVAADDTLSFDVVLTSDAGFDVTVDLAAGTLPTGSTLSETLPFTAPSPATITFEWTPPAAEIGNSYPLTFSGVDEFGQLAVVPLDVTVTVIEADDCIPFEHFLVWKLKIDKRPHKGTFHYAGSFRVGDESDGIYPEIEDVIIGFDSFELIIPAGSFRKRGHNLYRVMGVFDGVRVFGWLKEFRGRHHGHSWWTFFFTGKGADLSDVTNPVDTRLKVGDDEGKKTKWGWIKR